MMIKSENDAKRLVTEISRTIDSDGGNLFGPIPPLPFSFWIGANRSTTGDFLWIDGSEFSFESFASDDLNPNQNCLKMEYDGENILGEWYTAECTDTLSFICDCESIPNSSHGQSKFAPMVIMYCLIPIAQ